MCCTWYYLIYNLEKRFLNLECDIRLSQHRSPVLIHTVQCENASYWFFLEAPPCPRSRSEDTFIKKKKREYYTSNSCAHHDWVKTIISSRPISQGFFYGIGVDDRTFIFFMHTISIFFICKLAGVSKRPISSHTQYSRNLDLYNMVLFSQCRPTW